MMPAAASAASALARARAMGDAVLLLDAEKVWVCLRPRGLLAVLEGSEGPCLPPRGAMYWSRGWWYRATSACEQGRGLMGADCGVQSVALEVVLVQQWGAI